MPTRIMTPPPSEDWGARSRASTAPTSRPETSPVYDSSGGYQPTVPPGYPSVVPPYTPPRKRTPVGLILAFIGMGLFVLVVAAVMMMARFASRRSSDPGQPTVQLRQGEKELGEGTADSVDTNGNETTVTKTFALVDGAKVSINNVNGNITVTAWDQQQAQVSVIKRGGPADRNSPVLFTNNSGNLSIRTAQGRGDIRFEVKLPRELGRVELSSQNGVIKVSDVTAEILVNSTNGAIELTNVVGASKIRTTNGSIRAALLGASDRSMEFDSTNGSIDLTVPSDFEADLEASTVHGAINIDDAFGVQVDKGVVGQKAKGEIGQGGERLRLSTINGNLRIGKAEPRAKTSAKGKQNGN